MLSRDLLRTAEVDDRMIRREVRAERWRIHGTQTVAVHRAPLSVEALRWRALWEVGEQIAVLDGVSALQASGMTGFDDPTIHVSVKHTASVKHVHGVRVHKLIRRVDDEIVAMGTPRTTPAIAAVRAARWATTDRQAALVLVMPVQQRLCTGQQLLEASRLTKGRRRRRFVELVARDVADGAQSLGELDFAALCRARGIPAPARQSVRHGPRGRVYLDAGWDDIGLAVEIDGSGHQIGLAVTDDNLRQNDLAIADEVVLRINLVGLRLEGTRFLDQVALAHAKLSERHARSRYSTTRVQSSNTSNRGKGSGEGPRYGRVRASAAPPPTPVVTPSTSTSIGSVSNRFLPSRDSSGSSTG